MTALALGLVLASAACHVTWNYLAKASRDVFAFTWLLSIVATLVYLPFAALSLWLYPPPPTVFVLVGVSVVLNLAYFRLLSASYARADLSIVYPIARGTGLVLIPVVAAIFLREHMSSQGIGSIAVVVVGLFVVHTRGFGWPGLSGLRRSWGEPGSRLALLAGLTIAAYSVWDKNAVGQISPIVLDTSIFVAQAVFIAPFMLTRGRQMAFAEFRERPAAVIAAGVLAPLAYLLVLQALTFSRVAYVAPAREIGIVFGTLLGVRSLHEPFPINRLVGAGFIVAGVFGLALAP
ncbi:MAG TPA: DMT family transporter [Chloroflexota bacterium]|nr:DMT family transporter [Chloroflexota bacterium]